MRGKKKLWTVVAAAALLAGIAIAVFAAGRKPFRALDADEVAVARVRLIPPDVTLELDRDEILELVELLHEVRVTRRDDSYSEYDGQGVIFTLTLRDGVAVEAIAYAPFFVIDGEGYRTAYTPCAALNAFGNRLLRETTE